MCVHIYLGIVGISKCIWLEQMSVITLVTWKVTKLEELEWGQEGENRYWGKNSHFPNNIFTNLEFLKSLIVGSALHILLCSCPEMWKGRATENLQVAMQSCLHQLCLFSAPEGAIWHSG